MAAAAVAAEAVDVKDLNALDALHRLHALAHDAFQAVDQLGAQQGGAGVCAQHVIGLVAQALRLGGGSGGDAVGLGRGLRRVGVLRSEEHTSELQSLLRTSYAVFCLKKKISMNTTTTV